MPMDGTTIDLRAAETAAAATPQNAGGKAANLARLVELGLPTPNAVVLTTAAWRYFLEQAGIKDELSRLVANIEDDSVAVEYAARRIAALIDNAAMPGALAELIVSLYHDLSQEGARRLAIRSSGSYEDSPGASFSGILSTVLGVGSPEAAQAATRKCWASGFNARSLRYLARMELDPAGMAVAVIFQQMVKADSSGVLFTIDPATGDQSVAVLETAYGYGPGVVSGDVTPDLYRIDKETLAFVHHDSRPQHFYYGADGARELVEPEDREGSKLTDEEVRTLVRHGIRIETELGAPQDIEWCHSDEGMVLLQTRPLTGLERLSLRQKRFERPELVMVRGIGVSPRVGWGEVAVIDTEAGLPPLKGRVALVRRLTQDLAPRLRDAAAVLADVGGATSHGANILREFQVPCVVGTRFARDVLHEGDVVTVDGWRGLVLDGIGPRVKETLFGVDQLIATRTRLMTTINVPESAEKAAAIADGVISFRNDYLLLQGGVHPGRMIQDGEAGSLTASVFEALTIVAKAFGEKPVWYKTLDAPTDEFRRLRGGEDEPLERNPLLGWRGIGRELENPALLKAEYAAVRQAVDAGCSNLGIKVPFIRSVADYEQAREIAAGVGLRPHEDVTFGASIEVPAAVFILDQILDAQVDFISVGVNDLTMCCLGVDRESERVAERFDPAHAAVVRLLEDVVTCARNREVFTAAAGDLAQSPALMEQLVRLGYDALGVSLPYLGSVRGQVAKWEEE
ncbi:MAG: PEP/pyruvate-binding domain-containing protein [Thermoleophilia bacterium]